ncbi:sporulation histidine kinase inhibitor Sda [Halobacillus salinus]|uniref:sporulation histidine kinase inhibitor Sda n=1 Tax=Halobacillus salinus TaxID=192814 RepID=UPI0015920730|nr:sporulation histidine kinase inhibitor Sda [Halobacillus salinus]
MTREKGSVGLRNLSNQTLLDSYKQAMRLGLDWNFIEIIMKELQERDLSTSN